MNTTNATSTESNTTNVVYILGSCLAAVVVGFHCCAIYASVKSKELKKWRFLRLALFLSLSDSAIGVEIIYGNILTLLNSGNEAVLFQCMMIRDVTAGTVLSSLSHTLLICFDRLNASFSPKKRILNIITGNISVGLCFAIPHFYALSRFGINLWIKGLTCDPKNTTQLYFLIMHDLPVVLLICSIAVVYGVVAKRIIQHQRRIGNHGTALTETQIGQQKAKALRFRKSMATLGMIIIIAVISAFPRAVVGLYIYITDSYDATKPYLMVSGSLILLTPLLDPIIYLFRIKKFREQLVCKCCRSNAVADSIELH